MMNDKILIIDDDPDIGMMIKMMLNYKGYSTMVINSPLKINQSLEGVGLIVMDMLLSGSNGVDVCLQLKENELTKRIPVIMISAHPNAKEICVEAGADDFISKPFDMSDILERIGNFIPAPQGK